VGRAARAAWPRAAEALGAAELMAQFEQEWQAATVRIAAFKR
jgi:nitronate monooxygenase